MSQIKIISNPYQKETIIQKWNRVNEVWETINYDNSPQSALVSDDIKTGFFQFKVDEIVQAIYNDYHNVDEKIRIEFEGTEDDFDSLEKVCTRELYASQISLVQSERHLENASEILPLIRKIFTELEPLVEYCVTDKQAVAKDMEKFTEASDDCVPIVIMGNYSSGKSTFINALLGNEILPSGEEPVTAKVYKISKSESEDRASLSFTFHDEQKIDIKFTTKKYSICCVPEDESIIVKKLKERLESVKNESITKRLATALAVVNDHENDTVSQEISDLIEVTTPYNGGELAESLSKYVIFDTPGSNSASNERHLEVLKRAMENMSNGIPVFIAGFDSLDSTDNKNLYTKIKEMSELDSRFTMIIVNKADSSSLPSEGFTENKVKNILNQSVPKNLYSQGIYFVSSIMGLGSKLDGDLDDEHYSEIYDTQERNYSNQNSRHYKTLYKFNIMPEQVKADLMEEAESCENLVFANSGIYSVEMGLEAFAKKYSPYNKCEQSRLFLRNTIETTEKVISEKVTKSKLDKENMRTSLEKEKAELLAQISDKRLSLEKQFERKYDTFIDDYMYSPVKVISSDDLKKQQKLLEEKYQEEMKLDEVTAEVAASKASLTKDLKDGITREVSANRLAKIRRDFGDNLSGLQESRAKLKKTNKSIDELVSDELILINKGDFNRHAKDKTTEIDASSKGLWSRNAQVVRQELAMIINGSNALSSEQKGVLSTIIIQYGDIQFADKVDEIFIKDDLKFEIRLGNLVLMDSGKIRLEKLKRTFNSEYNKYIHNVCRTIKANHSASFKEWMNALISDVTENITEYSSVLKTQFEFIKKEEETILDLESKQQQIKNYSAEIEEMISWKE